MPSPAYSGDFPDPFLRFEDGRYWAYATGAAGRNLQVMTSTDLQTWSEPTDPLPELARWAAPGHTWSPAVLRTDDGYVMYFAVRDPTSGRQCISAAAATTPDGPFLDRSDGPLIRQADRAGAIDPDILTINGVTYLLWKSEDNALGTPTHLWCQPLAPHGRRLLGVPTRLLSQQRGWQEPVMEGPALLALPRDRFVLFYGANRWDSEDAGIGYATSQHPLGPFRDRSRRRPWLASRPGALGPSGPALCTNDDGVTYLAYHAWAPAVGYDRGGVRALFIERLTFTASSEPVLTPTNPQSS